MNSRSCSVQTRGPPGRGRREISDNHVKDVWIGHIIDAELTFPHSRGIAKQWIQEENLTADGNHHKLMRGFYRRFTTTRIVPIHIPL